MPAGAARSSPDKPVIITIGRTSANTVVLDQSNVSSQHARMVIADGEITLEDLGSTNGTSVGKVENKITKAKIRPYDTIFFGSSPYQVAEIIALADQPLLRKSPQIASPSTSDSKLRPATMFIATLVVAIVIGIGWLATRDSNSDKPVETIATSVSETTPTEPTPATPDLSADEILEQSLYVLVVSDAQHEAAFRVGTCFAIDEHRVATTASVASAMQEFQQNGFPNAYLFRSGADQQLLVNDVVIHPYYLNASREARTSQEEYDQIADQYEAEPPAPEQIESVQQQLLDAKLKAFEAMERQTVYDAAVISVTAPFEHWLTVAEGTSSLRPNMRLTVQGRAFDLEDPFFDAAEPNSVKTLDCRVQQLLKPTADAPTRLLGTAPEAQFEAAFLGSPVLNSQGQVVAIYSRPTPPPPNGEEQTSPPQTFDGPLSDRIRECLKP